MKTETLDELINRYENKLDTICDEEHDEIFKWRALKTFQQEWFSDEHKDFISRFNAATKDFSVFIDNSRMHPRNGVVKLYEKEPDEVERLFCEVLFADDDGDLTLRQNHMEEFISGMETLREKHFPANWSFKQDRHSASTFLAMYAPAKNYVYKFSEAEAMAVYGEYGFDLGSGANFNLSHYYSMCDEIVERLKVHKSLVDAHFKKLDNNCYYDDSLHLLAFDLIYCCRTYGYYKGLSHIAKKDSIKQAKEAEAKRAEDELLQKKIADITEQITELKMELPDVSDILLMNVEVHSNKYGTGMVIEHELNNITVRFSDDTTKFILDKMYPMRPTFENDNEVVEVYTKYSSIQRKIKSLEKQLSTIKS